jgi:hypothetical protein
MNAFAHPSGGREDDVADLRDVQRQGKWAGRAAVPPLVGQLMTAMLRIVAWSGWS